VKVTLLITAMLVRRASSWTDQRGREVREVERRGTGRNALSGTVDTADEAGGVLVG
jgi:hypothetical protein